MKKSGTLYWIKLENFIFKLRVKLFAKVKILLSDDNNFKALGLWVSAIAAALIAVMYAKLFRLAEEFYLSFLKDHTYFVLALSPILFFLAWILVYKFAPEAAGSGIPQIMAVNKAEEVADPKKFMDRLLGLKVAFFKVISSLLCVLGGGAIGREGPTLQISASIFHFFGKQVGKFVPQNNQQTWVVAGAAAGLASAFNTPLGGIVYAIEELSLIHFYKIRTALITAVIASGLVSQWILGNYLFLGFPSLSPVGIAILPAAILVGIITGFMGGVFGRFLHFVLKKRNALKQFSKLVLLTLACGVIAASLSLIDERSSGAGIHVITDFLRQKDEPSFVLVGIRFISTVVSYLSGAAGGIFSPSLTIGGTMGAFLSSFIGQNHANLMILLGMIGFLTGVTRTPFTSFILVLEMTDRHLAIFPMMITAVVAQWISRIIDGRSFYEHVMEKFLLSAKPQ